MILKSIIRKEMLHLCRDPQTLLVSVFMPVVLLLLFGFAISTEVNDVKVAVVVDTHTDRTRDICMRLQTNPYFTFVGEAPHADIDRLLRTSEADAVVVLHTDAGELSTQIVADGSNTTLAQSAQAYIRSVVSGEGAASSPIVSRVLYNPQLKSSYNFVPGILGKLIPYFLLSCVILAAMLLISYTALGLPFSAGVVNVVVISLLYIVLALSVGLLVSTLVRTEVAALIVSAIAFMIPVLMRSGMIFPLDNMPRALQWFSAIGPARWYISAMRKIMIQQLPLSSVWTEVAILAGMTALMLVLAIRKFKNSTN